MALGLGRLGWAPPEFWAATPRELAAAVEGLSGPPRTEPPSRAVLGGLMLQVPDENPSHDPAYRT